MTGRTHEDFDTWPDMHRAADVVPHLDTVPDEQLARSFEHCRLRTKREARNFYHGLKLTPEPRRSALYAIYAWMRRVDDEADSDGLVEARRQGIDRLREQTLRAYAGDPPLHADPMWPAVAATLTSYEIPAQLILDVLAGVSSDLDAPGCADDGELRDYCYRVASTVGLICVSIWGVRPDADESTVRTLAAQRGVAFQLTNILRDFGEDYDASPRRVYLPADAFEAAGIKPHELRAWVNPQESAAFVRRWVDVARVQYTESVALDDMIAPDCAPVLRAMTRIYSGVLDVIERDPQRVVRGPKASLPTTKKVRIALGARFAGSRP